MKHLIALAERGGADSQFNLGVVYGNPMDDNGQAVGGNRTEARKWLLRAAEQGLPRAQIRLAEMYAETPDASGDQVRACTWFLLAAANSTAAERQKAQSGYERICLRMSPMQIAKAKRLAQAWKPKGQDSAAAV